MLSTLVFLTIVGGSVLQVDSSVFKCDSQITDKIKKDIWKNDANNDILEKFGDSKYFLKASTPEYISSEYSGVYTTYKKEDGNVFTTQELNYIKKDGGDVSSEQKELIEAGGAVIVKSDKIKYYSTYSDNGIFAFYVCEDSDDAKTGPPAGIIIVDGSGGYTDDQYDTAVDKTESVGIKTYVKYDYTSTY